MYLSPHLAMDVAAISDPARIEEMIPPLYAVLNDPKTRPVGVRVTTLSKVLHRKHPKSIVLQDIQVERCYFGDDALVKPTRGRSVADYMAAITVAIAADIRDQEETFAMLDEASSSPGELSRIRLLDILAWRSGGMLIE